MSARPNDLRPASQPQSDVWANVNSGVPSDAPLTRVALAFVERRIDLHLRFGWPLRMLPLDRWRRIAVFAPGALFCRIRWEANEHGTTLRQLLVLQACGVREHMERIAGVQPGARILLRVEGDRRVPAVLHCIGAIDALGIDPAACSPAYWRILHNRLAAGLALPAYTAARHAAWMAGAGLR